MKSVAQIKSILLAIATVATLVGSTQPRVAIQMHAPMTQTMKVVCGESGAKLVLEMKPNGMARIGVEKAVEEHSQFKMMNSESLHWFESNGMIWVNDQISIDSQTGKVSVYASVLPTEFAISHQQCEGHLAILE